MFPGAAASNAIRESEGRLETQPEKSLDSCFTPRPCVGAVRLGFGAYYLREMHEPCHDTRPIDDWEKCHLTRQYKSLGQTLKAKWYIAVPSSICSPENKRKKDQAKLAVPC